VLLLPLLLLPLLLLPLLLLLWPMMLQHHKPWPLRQSQRAERPCAAACCDVHAVGAARSAVNEEQPARPRGHTQPRTLTPVSSDS
jgi:hypothetical protein